MDYEPLPKQWEAYDYLSNDFTKYLFYGGAAGGGKTWLGCEWEMMNGFYYPESRWFIGRNNLKDTRESVLITWLKVAKIHGFTQFKMSNDGIKFKNGSEVTLLDLTYYPYKDPLFERLGSKEYTGGWIEEAGEIHFGAFDTLKTRVGRHLNKEYDIKPKILVTMNPKKKWVYNTVYKPWKEGRLSKETAFVQALPSDNPHLTGSYIENLHSITDKARRERLLYGNWEYDDDPSALIFFDAINDLFENSHVKPGQMAMTCDIALRGSDSFKIYVWSDWQIVAIYSIAKCSGKEVVDKIKEVKNRYAVPNSRIVYDADGIGAFIGGQNGYLPGSKEFHNGASPIKEKEVVAGKNYKPNYENLKTQCYFRLAKRINDRQIWMKYKPSDEHRERIIAELEQVKERDIDKDGKLRLKRKEDVKTDLGHSPDDSDAMMMREFLELSSSAPFPDFL